MDTLMQTPLNLCSTKAGLAAGTTTTLTTANTQLFSLKGKAFSKAATSNEATPTTDAVDAAAFTPILINQGSVFTVGRDSAGALKVIQGTVEALDAQGNFINAPQFGPQLDTVCPIGYIVIKVASNGSTWTFGASNLSGVTGVTYAFVDCFTMPDRPQVA